MQWFKQSFVLFSSGYITKMQYTVYGNISKFVWLKGMRSYLLRRQNIHIERSDFCLNN